MTYVRACALADLDRAGGRLAVRGADRDAVVVRADTGGVFALDLACPHEGYPLDEGDVLGETITCPWHGWRFDLRSGTCLTAGEDARSYRVELRGDEVWVELDVEPSDAERERLREVLISAVEAGDADRAARAVVRLLGAGAAHADIVAPVARFAATHGSVLDLAGAALADALVLAEAAPDGAALILADAVAAVAERVGRAAPRFAAEPRGAMAFDDPGEALTARVAERDPDGAEALVRGLLARGEDPQAVARLIATAASARFRGRLPLALAERAARLAELGDEVARPVVAAAARAAAAAAPLDGVAPYAGRDLAPGSPAELADDLGETLLRFDAALESDDRGTASRLAVAEALVFLHAAAWSGDAAALAHARWLADDARAWRTDNAEATASSGDVLPALAGGAAASARGTAVCLAATRAALELGSETALAGVDRLLRTPRRERFTGRALVDERARRTTP